MYLTLFISMLFVALFLLWGLAYLAVWVVTRDRKAIERQIELGNKVFCFFVVKDSVTKENLAFGEKWRSFNDLVSVSSFNKGFRKIFVFQDTITINDIECGITYYANVSENGEPYFTIEPAGEKLFNENSNAQL